VLERWSRFNRSRKREVDGQLAPSRNDEYLLYQTLVGTWPLTDPDRDALASYRERIEAYALKAAREAKLRTSWFAANAEYEEALGQFVRAVLEGREGDLFLADLSAFVRRVSRFGLWSSLTQALCKLTAPGVPDIYQGCELWDFSLVDPDNRRAVDYGARTTLLQELAGAPETRYVRELAESPCDERTKLHVIARTLEVRRQREALFRDGAYVPLRARGAQATHVLAFARRRGEELAITIAPRLYARLIAGREVAPLGADVWTDTMVEVSALPSPTELRNVLDGRSLELFGGNSLRLAEVLADFPVALIVNQIR
jgi:(1->4)-alpha-D-glucan 1-alpha-D-glucosylmutase